MEKIDDLRKRIDEIDSDIIRLIEERAKIAQSIGQIKSKLGIGVVQPEREKKVLQHIRRSVKTLSPESAEAIWKELMSACKAVQGRKHRVCFLGPNGSFTQIAAEKFFPAAGSIFIPGLNKNDVFQRVEGDYVDFGIVPIENSLEGSVRETLDLLIENNLRIYGEIEIRIVHNLIGLKNTNLKQIKYVYSHPQALAQCNQWLIKNIPNAELIESSSTSKAVEKVKEVNSNDTVAIGTSLAADLYQLKVLEQGIEDNTQNYTRFLIISKQENMPTEHDKTSMVFVTKHVPGALFEVLKLFAEYNINLLKIESRPRKRDLWEYIFIVEFEGHHKMLTEVLEKIKEHTIWMKVLGSYPIFERKNGANIVNNTI